MQGKVMWFDAKRGFGFVRPSDGNKDVFVHHSEIVMDGYRTLEPDQKVEFEIGQGEKGPVAVNVKIVTG